MSIKEQYFRYLDHIDSSVTMCQLAQQPDNPNMIALRHDIDHDIDLALEMAHYEHERGIVATYFLLHTNEYWDDSRFLLKCKQLQDYGHEIGLHLNVLTQWMQGQCDDVDEHIGKLLIHLRSTGLEIVGTSAHGDSACYSHNFINYWIWKELRGNDPAGTEKNLSAEGIEVDDASWQVPYPENHSIIRNDQRRFKLWQSSLNAHGLTYDAVHVPHTNYWSDTGGKWKRTGDPLEKNLKTGRHQILVHPHWWRDKKRIIFVLSTARSGSKWLANFVENATSCRGLHEWTLNNKRTPDGYALDKRTNDDFMGLVETQNKTAALIRQALAHHRAIIKGDVLEANVYIEPFLDYIITEEPNVEFVHLHRDAKDVVRSILNRGWYDTPIDRRHFAVPIPIWDKLNQFERACCYVRWTQETAVKATNKRISFEKMVSDLSYITEVLRELGIIVHPLLAQEEFVKHIDPNSNTSMPPYQQWDQQYKSAFVQICSKVQQELGYKLDEEALTTSLIDIEIKSASNESIVRPVLQMDFIADNDLPRMAVHTNCIATNSGLSISTIDDKHSNAYVLLSRGKWDKIKPNDGCACESNVYYSAQIDYNMTPGMTVRVFLLLFSKRGKQISHSQIAVMRSGPEQLNISFTTHQNANHFALGLHLGTESPEHQLELCRILVNAVTLSDNYNVRYNTINTEILEPVVDQSAIDRCGASS